MYWAYQSDKIVLIDQRADLNSIPLPSKAKNAIPGQRDLNTAVIQCLLQQE